VTVSSATTLEQRMAELDNGPGGTGQADSAGAGVDTDK